jgi:hypothetical protein
VQNLEEEIEELKKNLKTVLQFCLHLIWSAITQMASAILINGERGGIS